MSVWVRRFLASDEQNDHTNYPRNLWNLRVTSYLRFFGSACSVPASFASSRASQPASKPRPPIGVIAPNHLKLVNAIAYSDPLKITTPIRVEKYASRGIGRHPLMTRSIKACTR